MRAHRAGNALMYASSLLIAGDRGSGKRDEGGGDACTIV